MPPPFLNSYRARNRYRAAALALTLPLLAAATPAAFVVGDFSNAPLGATHPPDWKPQTFDKVPAHTEYRIVAEQGKERRVLRAISKNAASGITRELAIDPQQYPIVSWRWKVDNILPSGDLARKSGDDAPARVYITFAYDPARAELLTRAKYRAAKLIYGRYPPRGALTYVWASNTERGARLPNPYAEEVRVFVLQSGRENLGQWVSESRNIAQDYRAEFGEAPPMISGIAVMTDTDNTGESATARFGDIVFTSTVK